MRAKSQITPGEREDRDLWSPQLLWRRQPSARGRWQPEHSCVLGLRRVVILKTVLAVPACSRYSTGLQLVHHLQWRRASVASPKCSRCLLVARLYRLGMHQSQPISFSIALFPKAFVVAGWGPSADLWKAQISQLHVTAAYEQFLIMYVKCGTSSMSCCPVYMLGQKVTYPAGMLVFSKPGSRRSCGCACCCCSTGGCSCDTGGCWGATGESTVATGAVACSAGMPLPPLLPCCC